MRSPIALTLVVLLACSPAPGDPIAATSNADRIFDADCPVPGATFGPDTFDAIYNELLGPKSVAQCQNPACHGGASEQGFLGMKNTAREAYDGMVKGAVLFPGAPGTEDPPPSVAGLVRVLVPLASTGKPRMPRELCGNRLLTAAEIDRIKRWGKAGAKFD